MKMNKRNGLTERRIDQYLYLCYLMVNIRIFEKAIVLYISICTGREVGRLLVRQRIELCDELP
jgi:hypothetical protein